MFAIQGVRTLNTWNEQIGYYLRFEFGIHEYCYGASKLVVDLVPDRNIVFRFTSHWIPDIPRTKSLERFLIRYDGWVKERVEETKRVNDQKGFNLLLQGLILFKIIRRLFDFNFFLEPSEVKQLNELYENKKAQAFRLGDLIGMILSKYWIDDLIIRLRNETKQYLN